MPRFFVPARDIIDARARLEGGEFRHLQRVLRLREGDHVTVFDDEGREHVGIILSMSPRAAAVRIVSTTTPVRESPLLITLYQGIPKGRKMDLIVEKATELGTRSIIPFSSAFSSAGPPAAAGKIERWQRIALAATKQSARTHVPTIGASVTFPEAIAHGAEHALKLLLYEGAGTLPLAELAATLPATPTSAAVFVGPEGGFSHDEVLQATERGFALVNAGPRVLRTETAALVAVSLVQARWGDLRG